MVTVHRAFGFRFVIYANDHPPPHAHVFGQGGEAKIVLLDESVRLDWALRVSASDLRKILQEALFHRERLIAAWRQRHDH